LRQLNDVQARALMAPLANAETRVLPASATLLPR